jgi:hypothetical protein
VLTSVIAILLASTGFAGSLQSASAYEPAPHHRTTPPPSKDCGDSTNGQGSTGAVVIGAKRACSGGESASGGGGPRTRTLDCGPPQVARQARPGPGDRCGQVRNICDVATAAKLPTDPTITTTVTLKQEPDGSWTRDGIDCNVKTATPHITALLVREQARKLVPHPGIGIAPPGGTTLVNIQTLLWLNTPANQRLGTLTLLGHRVTIHVHIERIDWTFGDGHTDTTTSPQRKYDPADGCHAVTCPGYWGHTYTSTGTMTIAATITWTGRYQVDGGPPLDIAGTVTSPATNTTVTVHQARGILVPGQNNH